MNVNKRFAVDRAKCFKCRYYSKECCDYFLETGKHREHDGDICYVYEHRSSQSDVKRVLELPPIKQYHDYDNFRVYLHHNIEW